MNEIILSIILPGKSNRKIYRFNGCGLTGSAFIFARRLYKIMGKLSNVHVLDGARDFRVMSLKYRKTAVHK